MPACLIWRIHGHRTRLCLGAAHAGLGHRPPLQGRAESEPDRSPAAAAAASAAAVPLACTTCLLPLRGLLLVCARCASSAAPSASRRLDPLLALVLHLGVLCDLGCQPARGQVDPHSWGLYCEHLVRPHKVSRSRSVFLRGHPPQLKADLALLPTSIARLRNRSPLQRSTGPSTSGCYRPSLLNSADEGSL